MKRNKTTYPDGSTIVYQYDDAERLKTITDFKSDGSLNAVFKYNLDQLGNRTTISSYQPLNAIPSLSNTSYTHANDNRLLTAATTSFEYDNNGNLITKTVGSDVTNYTWDFNDMLTQVTSGGNTYVYRYDGLGNRVARIENSAEKMYVGGLAEADASGNITAYYVYGLGLISKVTPTNQAYYYHYDGIGSTVAISDSTGNMVNKYAYDGFGKVLNQEEAIPNPFNYVGQFGVMDEGNGLFYMRARYYDPEVGRFINKDPIGFAGGLNMFTYVQNNPINFFDPYGLRLCRTSLPGLGNTYLDDAFSPLVQNWINANTASGINAIFTEAFRTTAYQEALANNPNAITPAAGGSSLHEAGFAVDVSWSQLNSQQRNTVVQNAVNAGLSWGGNFSTPDPVHFYHDPGNRSQRIREAQQGYQQGGNCNCP